jgi:hypothetical protein
MDAVKPDSIHLFLSLLDYAGEIAAERQQWGF